MRRTVYAINCSQRRRRLITEWTGVRSPTVVTWILLRRENATRRGRVRGTHHSHNSRKLPMIRSVRKALQLCRVAKSDLTRWWTAGRGLNGQKNNNWFFLQILLNEWTDFSYCILFHTKYFFNRIHRYIKAEKKTFSEIWRSMIKPEDILPIYFSLNWKIP